MTQEEHFPIIVTKRVELDSSTRLCLDNSTRCTTRQTCCMKSGNQFGCCPYENAVCCKDVSHCCPHNFKCNENSLDCVHAETTKSGGISLNAVTLGYEIESVDIVCPDHVTSCSSNQTCCPVSEGYGCCPAGPDAVCCSDLLHCCPNGYACEGTMCVKGEKSKDVVSMFVDLVDVDGDVTCPDGGVCPSNVTCCMLENGRYGCCSEGTGAVCCADRVHCCPRQYKCDLSTSQCVSGRGGQNGPLLTIKFTIEGHQFATKKESLETKGRDESVGYQNKEGDHEYSGVKHDNNLKAKTHTELLKFHVDETCPDGHVCPSNATCCLATGGRYGCCPAGPESVCCTDHIHCCPHGYKCDGTLCEKTDSITGDVHKQLATQLRELLHSVTCPDEGTCPDNNTCCPTSGGRYNCCPAGLDAVCCSDDIHCCPNGYACSGNVCLKTDQVTGDVHKKLATQLKELPHITCPDGGSCPDNNTCCLASNGQYGCCPAGRDAVCCSDHIHCCPQGTSCSGTICVSPRDIDDQPASQLELKSPRSIYCPDGRFCSNDNSTCCRIGGGHYGCCPAVNATCCPDQAHCCPHGMICAGKICKHASTEHEATRMKLISISKTGLNQDCPCHANQTCCLAPGSGYACCGAGSDAVCCVDHIHCCPHGFSCNLDDNQCVSRDQHLLQVKHSVESSYRQSASERVQSLVCPDGKSECPDVSTCCKNGSKYACCPVENAVCCPDGIHCCDPGYKCDMVRHGCIKSSSLFQLIANEPDKMSLQTNDENAVITIAHDANNEGSETVDLFSVGEIVCPGGHVECSNNQTCCHLADNLYGCCPVAHAVCCSDHLHCCPAGYSCDSTSGQCIQPNKAPSASMTLAGGRKVRVFATKHEVLGSNKMVDGNDVVGVKCLCPDGNTCCKGRNAVNECCPLANAVCCGDHLHCCPNGFKCDSSGTCVRGD